MAVDEKVTTTLDEGMISRLGEMLAELGRGQHRNAHVSPHVKYQSAEFLTSFVRSGYPLDDLLPFEIESVSAHEYNQDQELVERSKRENWFYPSRFSNRRMFQDYRSIGGNVLLHNEERQKQGKMRIIEYMSRSREKVVPELHYALKDRFEDIISNERPEFVQDVYSTPDALAFVGEHYAIDDGAKLLRSIFPESNRFFQRLEIAYGAETTVQYARDRYKTPTRVGKVLLAAYGLEEHGPEKAFEYTRMAFRDRFPAAVSLEGSVREPPANSGSTYHPSVTMQKQS